MTKGKFRQIDCNDFAKRKISQWRNPKTQAKPRIQKQINTPKPQDKHKNNHSQKSKQNLKKMAERAIL